MAPYFVYKGFSMHAYESVFKILTSSAVVFHFDICILKSGSRAVGKADHPIGYRVVTVLFSVTCTRNLKMESNPCTIDTK